ncbi:hypothetical protein QVD17_34406 [Tagetes erecta]|uniref:Jacalin-type lectin domain-containing protein n=1 Tax=Tagetes erecta TaxID=13708 RepID=A0AAD8JYH5_TARER|nr:hypothetical protein QVD17_34406 [Tagetes erecta]
MVRIGAWGGSGGGHWSFIPNGRITNISICSGAIVDAISFTFIDVNGNTYQSVNFGGSGGMLHEIPLEMDEEIIKISGRFGAFQNNIVVISLTFVTNKKTYGQYGTDGGTDFSLPVDKGKIIGFYGKCSGFLDSIGVVLSP